ncbi:tagaturonate reductase [Ruminococcaceae bacterium OttesenSCG-928-A16]|nr:tagaturonate reductase [Ruminococcaceae bacterium OttesenSCG-928-A16]
MEKLSYSTLEKLGYKGYLKKEAPERILQFGEGNFLRAFVDDFVDIANEKCDFNTKVLVVQPIGTGRADAVNQQDGLYTLYRRGFESGKAVNEKRINSALSRCLELKNGYGEFLQAAHNPDLRFVVSNTTEAGIVFEDDCRFDDTPPASYPAKLTRFLYERFTAFGTQKGKGLVILPCELIDFNGEELEKCVKQYIQLWNLEPAFTEWLDKENMFCSTLVDRIVTGYPAAEAEKLQAENGYIDEQLDTCEIFGLWVIEGPQSLKEELPFEKVGLPVLITDDHRPYKQRKVRILNGAHTSMSLAAYLAGQDIVRDCMEDQDIYNFTKNAIFDEIIPTLTLPKAELEEFANAVLERFKNPFIDHSLLSISLNSVSKWRARVLPTVKDYVLKTGQLPARLTFGFAALLAFYHAVRLQDGKLIALRDGQEYTVQDDAFVLEFFDAHKNDAPQDLVAAVCANTRMWGEDLNQLPGFAAEVTGYLETINKVGMQQALKQLG